MFRYLFEAPVTYVSLVVLATVFAGTHGIAGNDSMALSRLQRQWGAPTPLTWVTHSGGRAEVTDSDLQGPFDVWAGESWRVPLASLHHVAFWHILLNMLSATVMGRLLEHAWGSWRYGVFLVSSAAVSLLPTYLMGAYSLGYSGVLCAILGALIVVRQSHPQTAAVLNNPSLYFMLASLVGMALATFLELWNIDNLAHFSGLGYGWLVAQAAAQSRHIRWGMIALHALLIVPYWAVVHPTWNGRYHWYRAGLTTTGQIADSEDPVLLHRAVACDPTLGGAWLLLADDAERNGRIIEAWGLTLTGLHHQPAHERLWSAARRRWRRLVGTPHRAEAVTIVETIFDEHPGRILSELRRWRMPPVLIAPDRPIGPRPEMLAETTATPPWQPSSSQTWQALTRQWPIAPPLDPNDPRSALEGETL